jgi:hypothetical protein
MAACRFEVHHCLPRCLLGFFDRFAAGDLDGEGLQAWFKWEEEAFRYGVNPDVSREELELLIKASASPVPAATHSSGHSRGGDFARWGRRGGLRTLALYGRGWFVLLAGKRGRRSRRSNWPSPSRSCARGGPDGRPTLLPRTTGGYARGSRVTTGGQVAFQSLLRPNTKSSY